MHFFYWFFEVELANIYLVKLIFGSWLIVYHMGEKRDERECAAKKEERRIRGGQIQFQRKKKSVFLTSMATARVPWFLLSPLPSWKWCFSFISPKCFQSCHGDLKGENQALWSMGFSFIVAYEWVSFLPFFLWFLFGFFTCQNPCYEKSSFSFLFHAQPAIKWSIFFFKKNKNHGIQLTNFFPFLHDIFSSFVLHANLSP